EKRTRRAGGVKGKPEGNKPFPGPGYNPGTPATPMPQEAVKNRLLDLWSTPHGSLKAAVAAGAAAKLTTENGTSVITFPLSGLLAGITMKVTLNSNDQVEKVETRMGNDTAETTYSDYKDPGEIKSDVLFPAHIVQKKGNRTLDLTITKADMNNPYVVFPVPDNVEKAQRD